MLEGLEFKQGKDKYFRRKSLHTDLKKNTVFKSMLFPRRKASIANTAALNIGTLVKIFFYLVYTVRHPFILQNVNVKFLCIRPGSYVVNKL